MEAEALEMQERLRRLEARVWGQRLVLDALVMRMPENERLMFTALFDRYSNHALEHAAASDNPNGQFDAIREAVDAMVADFRDLPRP